MFFTQVTDVGCFQNACSAQYLCVVYYHSCERLSIMFQLQAKIPLVNMLFNDYIAQSTTVLVHKYDVLQSSSYSALHYYTNSYFNPAS